MTDEIYMTVPAKYVTLSNGKLISSIKNADGTRTDYWKMDLPHSPYLLFMGVGEFSIVKDSYKGKEVSYYVEKEYEKVARKIFGLTPEMIKFFSEKVTGIDFPWAKYAQIVGRDYVSGAMENTTSTLHGEGAQQNARELVDGNVWESTIAHELFHQWFGDLVTAESWSNITVNESFADYSEYLWNEYKYGMDAALDDNVSQMGRYFSNPADAKKDLVRFYYADKEDVFDNVSYPKGGRILNMLRHYVGDSAFFKSLNYYLTVNKFGNGSAHKLRLAFEQVTGMDLNWFSINGISAAVIRKWKLIMLMMQTKSWHPFSLNKHKQEIKFLNCLLILTYIMVLKRNALPFGWNTKLTLSLLMLLQSLI